MSVLPLERTELPGVYRRDSASWWCIAAAAGSASRPAATLAEARAVKLARDEEARTLRRGPTLHAFALGWLDRYAGSGRDSVRENTRREYRRLLETFALRYFDREVRVRDLDRPRCSASSTGSLRVRAARAGYLTVRWPTR